MWLGDNELTSLSFSSFGPNLDLFDLRLERNKLKFICPDSFRSAHSLLELYLANNLLDSVPCFSDLVLYLEGNPLESQPKSCWISGQDRQFNGSDACVKQICDKPLKSIVQQFEWGKVHCCTSEVTSSDENYKEPKNYDEKSIGQAFDVKQHTKKESEKQRIGKMGENLMHFGSNVQRKEKMANGDELTSSVTFSGQENTEKIDEHDMSSWILKNWEKGEIYDSENQEKETEGSIGSNAPVKWKIGNPAYVPILTLLSYQIL